MLDNILKNIYIPEVLQGHKAVKIRKFRRVNFPFWQYVYTVIVLHL